MNTLLLAALLVPQDPEPVQLLAWNRFKPWIDQRLEKGPNLALRAAGTRLESEPGPKAGDFLSQLQDGVFGNDAIFESKSVTLTLELADEALVDAVAFHWKTAHLLRVVLETRRGGGGFSPRIDAGKFGKQADGLCVIEFPAVAVRSLRLRIEADAPIRLTEVVAFESPLEDRTKSAGSRGGLGHRGLLARRLRALLRSGAGLRAPADRLQRPHVDRRRTPGS